MKEGKKPKILLLADYSNFHATLAKGLRRLGCEVTLVSDGGTYMMCERDIDISRRYDSKVGGLLHAINLYLTLKRKIKEFDIVSFRDPAFLNLKPDRIRWFFNQITSSNSNFFLSYLTTDIPFLNMLEREDSPLRYSEWFVEGRPNRLRIEDEAQWEGWHSKPMRQLNDLFYSRMKGAVTALYEYHLAARSVFPEEKIAYGGIPIDLDEISPQEIDRPKKIRIFLARDYRRKLQKGSDLMEEVARRVVDRYPDKAEFVMIENVPRSQYMDIMRSCHVLLDQMYSYTPATTALEGMASGLTVVSGAEPEFYEFIGEKENFPIVNASIHPELLEKSIEELVTHPNRMLERSRRGREFVTKHNHLEVVARRFLNFWLKNV